MTPTTTLIISFVLTVIVEFFIFWLFFRKNLSALKIFYLCFLINLFSWPLANLFYEVYGSYNNWLVIELCVFAVESFLLMLLFRARWWKAMLASFVANLITALMGLFLIVSSF